MKKLIYFSDPMCSWCYAFNSVIVKLREYFSDLEIDLVAGGYSPGNTEILTEKQIEFLKNTWKSVALATGAKFNYDLSFIDSNFFYDTEPPSRALKVIQIYDKGVQFDYLELMQRKFYVDNIDITKEYVLADLAVAVGLDWRGFIDGFNSDAIKKATIEDFNFSRKMEVGGFPTILALNGDNCLAISHGYQPYKFIKDRIDLWLNEITNS